MERDDIQPIGEFTAFCRGGSVDGRGDLSISFSIPKEDKYNALPITDDAGIMLVVKVYRKDQFITEDGPVDLSSFGFVMPEGGAMGDGSGEPTYAGGTRQSKDIKEDLEVPDRKQYHRKKR